MAADLVHHGPTIGDSGQGQLAPAAARMLEGVVQSRHFDELDRSVEVLGEPELFEVRDMTEIPDDGTHQGIVLEVEIFVREGGHEQERSRPRFLQLCGDRSRVHTA